jgi:uncharacterized protein (TIGR00369 family)
MLSKTELEDLLIRNLPAVDHHDEVVEQIGDGNVRIRVPFREEYLGADIWGDSDQVVFSGPMVMALADTAMYGCIHANLGRDVVAVIVTINITFLRPAKAADLIAEARIMRRGKRLVNLEAHIYSDGESEPMMHATSTYSVRSRSNG